MDKAWSETYICSFLQQVLTGPNEVEQQDPANVPALENLQVGQRRD